MTAWIDVQGRVISPLGWIRIAFRLTAMIVLFCACLPLFALWRPIVRPNPWIRRFMTGIAWLAGISIRTTGARAEAQEILLVNHISWIDIVAISRATGSAFVANDGLVSVPLVHWLCRMNGTVFVARHQRSSVADQAAMVRAAINEARTLTLFPEGTTSDGTGLLPFKSSLLAAFDPVPDGVCVQPVWLDYGAQAQDVAWIGDEPGLANFLRILSRARRVRMTVAFLAPLSGEAIKNRKTMASAAREAILAAMDQRVAL